MTEKLDKNHTQLISKNDLKHAMAYGCANSSDKALRKMVSTIMVSIWSREYMATHSISGHKSPTDKTGAPPKTKLDDDPFQAIICMSFLYLCCFLQTKFFIIYYSIQSSILEKHIKLCALDIKSVKDAIETKLNYEHTQHRKSAVAADQVNPPA